MALDSISLAICGDCAAPEQGFFSSLLDRAVVAAYGFDPEEDLLSQVFALNEDVATAEAKGRIPRAPGNAGLQDTHATTSMIPAPTL